TADAGAFSGKLQIGKMSAPISGTFTGGVFERRGLTLAKQSLSVQLQWEASSARITGSVSGATWNPHLTSDRAAYHGKVLVAPQAGHYTFVIPGSTNSPNLPVADGYGTVSVTTAGRLSLAGLLADGTKITESTSLSTNGQWPLFGSLYNGMGSVVSW